MLILATPLYIRRGPSWSGSHATRSTDMNLGRTGHKSKPVSVNEMCEAPTASDEGD